MAEVRRTVPTVESDTAIVEMGSQGHQSVDAPYDVGAGS